MPKAKSVKKEKATKKEPKYLVSLSYNEKVVKLEGDDLHQIFNDYQPEPFKSLIIIKVKSGDKEVERLWPVIKARRCFGNDTNALVEASLLSKLLV